MATDLKSYPVASSVETLIQGTNGLEPVTVASDMMDTLKTINTSPNILLIGVSKYQNLAPLNGVEFDITCVKRRFIEMGFEPIECLNTSKAHMMEQIKLFKERVSATLNILYYSGHGYVKGDRLRLISKEATLKSLEEFSFDLDDLSEAFSNHQGGINLIVLDCCRSSVTEKEPFSKVTQAQIISAYGCLTVKSCLLNNASYLNHMSNFTSCFLRHFHAPLDIRGSILQANVMCFKRHSQQAESVDNSTLYNMKIKEIKGQLSPIAYKSTKVKKVILFLDPRVTPFWHNNESWSDGAVPYTELINAEGDIMMTPLFSDNDFSFTSEKVWYNIKDGALLYTIAAVTTEKNKILSEVKGQAREMLERLPLADFLRNIKDSKPNVDMFKAGSSLYLPGTSVDRVQCRIDGQGSHSSIELLVSAECSTKIGKDFIKVRLEMPSGEVYTGWVPSTTTQSRFRREYVDIDEEFYEDPRERRRVRRYDDPWR